MRFGTTGGNAYILRQAIKSAILRIFLRNYQKHAITTAGGPAGGPLSDPAHGFISSDGTEDPLMKFPRRFEVA